MKNQIKNPFIISFILASLISVFFNITQASANPQGTTTIVYVAAGQDLVSKKPNTLSIDNGVISIILGDGSRVSFTKDGEEINEG